MAHPADPDARSATDNLARAYGALCRREEAKPLFQAGKKQGTNAVDELSDKRLCAVLAGGTLR
jgi:hypothetical protein